MADDAYFEATRARSGLCGICFDDVFTLDGRLTHVATYGDSMHPPTVATPDQLRDHYQERLAAARADVAECTAQLAWIDPPA